MGETATGMQSIVTQLTTGITSAGLFGTVAEIIPYKRPPLNKFTINLRHYR